MIVPLQKDFEKKKLLDEIDNCGLTKVEIAKKTSDENGYGKISVQTIYDMYDQKHEPKLFQIKEILRVINEHKNINRTLAEFVSEEISRTPVVLYWNFELNKLEPPSFRLPNRTVYFPSVINQPKTMRAIYFDPNGHTQRKDVNVSLFDINKIVECCDNNKVLDKYLHRYILAEDNDMNFFIGRLLKIHNDIIFMNVFAGIEETYVKKHDVYIYNYTNKMKEISYKNIYPLEVFDLSIEHHDIILD